MASALRRDREYESRDQIAELRSRLGRAERSLALTQAELAARGVLATAPVITARPPGDGSGDRCPVYQIAPRGRHCARRRAGSVRWAWARTITGAAAASALLVGLGVWHPVASQAPAGRPPAVRAASHHARRRRAVPAWQPALVAKASVTRVAS